MLRQLLLTQHSTRFGAFTAVKSALCGARNLAAGASSFGTRMLC